MLRQAARVTACPSLPLLVLGLCACPQATEPAPAPTAPVVPATDNPRVVADGDHLYPAQPKSAPPPPPTPGTGRPDETNGECRLYAPELPNPTCCPRQLGFDVETVKSACNLQLYLGESFYAHCGYYFLPKIDAAGVPEVSFRLSLPPGDNPQDAAERHDRAVHMHQSQPSSTVAPFPGVEGVYWVRFDHLRWAFIPGWSRVRMLSWNDGTCDEAGLQTILNGLLAAPEVPADAPRSSLVPRSHPQATP